MLTIIGEVYIVAAGMFMLFYASLEVTISITSLLQDRHISKRDTSFWVMLFINLIIITCGVIWIITSNL